MQVNLVVDIGNSSVKIGIFDREKLMEAFRQDKFDYADIEHLTARYSLSNLVICSVKNSDIPERARLSRLFGHYLELTAQTPLPIENRYKTPETLGKDRIAAVVGGRALFPNRNLLIIDAGTAITFDFLDKEGRYLGGNISPGMTMRYNALHQATQGLPLVGAAENNQLLGQSTEEAIRLGVQNGIIFEMNHYIENLELRHQDLTVLLTGGDSNFFDNKLKYTIFVESNLVLIGLNEILKYNIYAK